MRPRPPCVSPNLPRRYTCIPAYLSSCSHPGEPFQQRRIGYSDTGLNKHIASLCSAFHSETQSPCLRGLVGGWRTGGVGLVVAGGGYCCCIYPEHKLCSVTIPTGHDLTDPLPLCHHHHHHHRLQRHHLHCRCRLRRL